MSNQELNFNNNDEEINFGELWKVIWAGKFIIIIVSFIFVGISAFYAISKPDIYRASIIVTDASNKGGSGGLASLAGQFGGLASMAGINLGSKGNDKVKLALEIIKSRSFIEKFINKYNLMIPIMAVNGWDANNDDLIINEKIFDKKHKKWIRKSKSPKPSLWEAYTEFVKLLSVDYEKKSAIITIDLEYYSPKLAQQWLAWLVADLNTLMREQDLKETKSSIDYLKAELKDIEVSSMRNVFYQLLEEQTKNMMLIKAKPEYVLKTVDPAQVPDVRAKPNRVLIVILGGIVGFMLSIFIVLVREKIKSK